MMVRMDEGRSRGEAHSSGEGRRDRRQKINSSCSIAGAEEAANRTGQGVRALSHPASQEKDSEGAILRRSRRRRSQRAQAPSRDPELRPREATRRCSYSSRRRKEKRQDGRDRSTRQPARRETRAKWKSVLGEPSFLIEEGEEPSKTSLSYETDPHRVLDRHAEGVVRYIFLSARRRISEERKIGRNAGCCRRARTSAGGRERESCDDRDLITEEKRA